jgi:hypothetical protein
MTSRFLASTLFAAVVSTALSVLSARELAPPLPDGEWQELLDEIKPQPGESPWREIAWLTDVTEARRQSVANNKPIVIFTAADGSPLGRT